MKISVLGVGTELTDGQVLNRNAQWISQRLKDLGVTTSAHLVVPDDRKLIQESLEFCWPHSDLVFVTGGLGPTSDDFTRDVLAQWLGLELIWHEASWKHIQDRLLPRGIAVKDIQRQQCYYPQGAEILSNRLGTANAFRLEHQGKHLIALPGPPGEIAGLWQDHLGPWLKSLTAHVDAIQTVSWDTLGLGESDIADKVESALQGRSYDIGYRVHMPFVEVKISYPKSRESQMQTDFTKVTEALAPFTVLRNGEDAAEILSRSISSFPQIWICDEVPGSFLLQRIFPFCKALLRDKKFHFTTNFNEVPDDFSCLVLHLQDDGVGSGRARWLYRGQVRSQLFLSPYKSSLLKEREQQFYAEMALIFWRKELSYDDSINPK